MKNPFKRKKAEKADIKDEQTEVTASLENINPASGETKVNTTKKVKRKPSRKIKRICNYCLKKFPTTRTDAKYCTNNCKQSAYNKNYDVNKYPSPAEYFFAIILADTAKGLLEEENKRIHLGYLNMWRSNVWVAETLFIKYLDEDSHIKKMYYKLVKPIFERIDGYFRQTVSKDTLYYLHPNERSELACLVDSLRLIYE